LLAALAAMDEPPTFAERGNEVSFADLDETALAVLALVADDAR